MNDKKELKFKGGFMKRFDVFVLLFLLLFSLPFSGADFEFYKHPCGIPIVWRTGGSPRIVPADIEFHIDIIR